jgi:hypothetical protein
MKHFLTSRIWGEWLHRLLSEAAWPPASDIWLEDQVR